MYNLLTQSQLGARISLTRMEVSVPTLDSTTLAIRCRLRLVKPQISNKFEKELVTHTASFH